MYKSIVMKIYKEVLSDPRPFGMGWGKGGIVWWLNHVLPEVRGLLMCSHLERL